MILADTSVWVDHLRKVDPMMSTRLSSGDILCHPFVIGELALGRIPERSHVLGQLDRLPVACVADDDEVIDFIDLWSLIDSGIGYIDAHLLAAVKLTLGSKLWTRDRRLATIARSLGVAFDDQAKPS